VPFIVKLGDKEFNTDYLTVDEAQSIEKETRRTWGTINPFRSAEDCKAIMVAFLSRPVEDGGLGDHDDAVKKVGKMSVKAALAAISVADDDLPEEYEDGLPKAGTDSASTDGS
jgi:hypothetical protein